MRVGPAGAMRARRGWLAARRGRLLQRSQPAPGELDDSAGSPALAIPTGPQPLWTTFADGPRLPGNARPSCDSEHLGRSLAVDDNGDFYVSGLATNPIDTSC